MKKIAEFISFVFNPLFVILAIILLGIEKSPISQTTAIIFTFIVVLFNGFLPAYIMLYYSKKGIVIDDIVYNKAVLKNRSFLLAWGTIFLFLESLIIYLLGKPQPIFVILFSLFLLLMTLFSVNIFRKISLHSSGITFFTLAILFLFGWMFWPILVLIPLIFWSRFYLIRHTIKQLLAGFLLTGIIISTIFYLFHLIPKF